MTTPAALVAECDERLRPLETAVNRAWWEANVDASAATEQRRAAAEIELSDALADAETYAAIRAARAGAEPPDPTVARALVVLENLFTPHQVGSELRRAIIELQASVEARFAAHRATIDGVAVDDNVILDVLRRSDDVAERRAAWEAAKSVGTVVAGDARRLARLRNDAARRLGFRDHFAMTLATNEYDEARLFATLDEVDRATRTPFAAIKARLDERLAARFGVDPADLRPWHYDDPFFQEVPGALAVDLDPLLRSSDLVDLTVRTFDAMGLDVRDVLERSDLLPRAGKVQHAFCMDVDRAGDVRVLCNNVPGARWAETMLHEFGHAAYFQGIGRDLPWLLRTTHMCLTEGVAMRCGRLAQEPLWLRRIAGASSAEVDGVEAALRARHRAALLVFARWVLVMTHFERGLYADPDGPHDHRWWDLVEHYQLVRRPDGRDAPDWAAKIHISVAPVYYHNYLFGELVASQLRATFGDLVDHRDTGPALRERLFAAGASARWDALVERATGAPLSVAALRHELRG